MVNVAIAGGTSPTLGKSIVTAILATGKHNVIILSRAKGKEGEKSEQVSQQDSQQLSATTSSSSSRPSTLSSVPIISINYLSSPRQIAQILQTHKITHLISVLKTIDPAISLKIHKTLLQAAHLAKSTRFIMSDWSVSSVAQRHVDLLGHKGELHALGVEYMKGAKAIGKDHVVECATVQPGGFLEYFVQGFDGGGTANEDAWEVDAGLKDPMMAQYIDIARRRLVVPCISGHDDDEDEDDEDKKVIPARVSMTSLHDIGKYMAASLDLPYGQMTGYIGIAGHIFRFTDIIGILSRLDPPVKIGPTYITKRECDEDAWVAGEKLKAVQDQGGFDVGLLIERMVAQIFACMCGEEEGGGVVSGGVMLNELCPEVERVRLEELLRRAWEGGGGGTENPTRTQEGNR